MSCRTLKLFLLVAALCGAGLSAATIRGANWEDTARAPLAGPFAPSNARTEDGNPIPARLFIPASRCAACHQDSYAHWAESLHRHAGREPFYRESVEILSRARGIEYTRHCDSCHAPVSVLSGSLIKGNEAAAATAAEEGVTCSVCHAVTETRLDGNGSYTVRRPALLAREDGTPIYTGVSDEAIMADVPGHRRAVMSPLLQSSEFCAACHKMSTPPELNNFKQTRGFSTYDDWQRSAASRETAAAFNPQSPRMDCRSCHMPRTRSPYDFSAKGGTIASHRFIGANTAVPLFYEQKRQAAETAEFLRRGVIDVDLFSLREEATGAEMASLDAKLAGRLKLAREAEVTVAVVVSNRNTAHSFPPELRDLYEPWIEFEALDSAGKRFFHSGYLGADGELDARAHRFGSTLLDRRGNALNRHEVWEMRARAYDHAIAAGSSVIVRYRFRLPENGPTDFTLRARVNYRRFRQSYAAYVAGRREASDLPNPIIRKAETSLRVGGPGEPKEPVRATVEETARRWNDYARGLFAEGNYPAASAAFRRASALNPSDPELLVSAAASELQPSSSSEEQRKEAALLLGRALSLNARHPRARFYRARLWRSEGREGEARAEFERLAAEFPRDREVLSQLAELLAGAGQTGEARSLVEKILGIDPTDSVAYQSLAEIYRKQGRQDEARSADASGVLWREERPAESSLLRFFDAHPELAGENAPFHVHGPNLRPTTSGSIAETGR